MHGLWLLRAGPVHHGTGAVGIPGARPRASARAARSARHLAHADQVGGAHRAPGRCPRDRQRGVSADAVGSAGAGCHRDGVGHDGGKRVRRAAWARCHPQAGRPVAAGGGGCRQAARRRQAADDHHGQRRAARERGRARARRGARCPRGGLPRRPRHRGRGPRARHLLPRRLSALARDRRAGRHRHARRAPLHALDRHDVADRAAASAAAPDPHRHRSRRDASAGAARRHRGGCRVRHACAAGGRTALAGAQGAGQIVRCKGPERGALPHRRRQGRGARRDREGAAAARLPRRRPQGAAARRHFRHRPTSAIRSISRAPT